MYMETANQFFTIYQNFESILSAFSEMVTFNMLDSLSAYAGVVAFPRLPIPPWVPRHCSCTFVVKQMYIL